LGGSPHGGMGGNAHLRAPLPNTAVLEVPAAALRESPTAPTGFENRNSTDTLRDRGLFRAAPARRNRAFHLRMHSRATSMKELFYRAFSSLEGSASQGSVQNLSHFQFG
jgi:hypothetical protein